MAYGAASAKRASPMPRPAMPMTTDRMTDQSPNRPPTRLPTKPGGPEDEQEDRHRGRRQPGHLGDRGGDVGVHREHATEADRTDAQGEPHLQAGQGAQLVAHGAGAVARQVRHGIRDEGHRRDADDGDQPVGRAPAEVLAEPGRPRHAEHVGDGDAEHHLADGTARLAAHGEVDGHEGGDAEEGPVRETGDEARRHEQAVVRRDRAQDVADGERDHQADEQCLARPGRREQREERRTDDDAGGVGGDGVPGRGDVDADAGRDVGQQAHRDELGRADGDAAEDQGEGRQGGVTGLGHVDVQRTRTPARIPAGPAFAAMSHRVHTSLR